MATPIHSKIINNAAKEVLKPLGLRRKGQSRIWLDDNGWWVTIVEFQPSGWSKGTYLNVGVAWLWYPKKHYSFDLGYRVNPFIPFNDETSFQAESFKLANKAAEITLKYRTSLVSPQKAIKFVLENSEGGKDNVWTSLHKGMSCLHARDFNTSIKFFEDVINSSDNRDWTLDVKEYTRQLIRLNPKDQISFVHEKILESRTLKRLPEMKILFGTGI